MKVEGPGVDVGGGTGVAPLEVTVEAGGGVADFWMELISTPGHGELEAYMCNRCLVGI